MATIFISVGVAVLTFGFGIAGLFLQRLLPEQHTTDRSRDMIAAIVGLVSLLLALVLGTLIGNTYGFFANQKTELESFAARSLQLDLALAQYGPETKGARVRLKEALTQSYQVFFEGGDSDPRKLKVATAAARWQPMKAYLASLDPPPGPQKQALADANFNFAQIENTRLLMSLQLASPISLPLLIVVVSWSFLLFCGFGVLSRANATTIVALALGAFAVASAISLILDLSQPYSGLFRVPAAALEQSIDAMDN
jgi:hypothetical protein